jgi:cytochrome c peroxidase
MAGRPAFAAAVALLVAFSTGHGHAEFGGTGGILPAGAEFNDEALDRPRELFKSEAIGGRKSYMVNLGDLAFSAPSILGGPARQAGMSCNTCHVNGTTNPRLFVPGMSLRPGTFDTTGPLFNPKADNGVLDPVTVPSLRGARFLAPYGHDGRSASLRDFVHNVIVNEFSGPEPSPEILDALVAYIEDIDFLPNRRLGQSGKLAGRMSEAEKRGEAVFYKPFTHDPGLSCAGCHVPSAGFVDHRQHDVGSGGLFKTPTLLNANFNAPYFHDGRYATYAQVVVHFDRIFYLGLSAQDRQDLAAYLEAIGDGEQPFDADSIEARIKEIADFASVLDTAIPARSTAIIALAVTTIGGELRELAEHFPERKNTTVSGGIAERARARALLKQLVLRLREVEAAASDGRFDAAAVAFALFSSEMTASLPLLKEAEPWSLFNRPIHDAHAAALRDLYKAAIDPKLAAQRRLDPD